MNPLKLTRMASGGTERGHGTRRGQIEAAATAASKGPGFKPGGKPKNKVTAGAWEEARGIVWKHRQRLALGLVLMVINRLAGLVLPFTSKYLMDDVVVKGNWDLLPTLALAAGTAT